jgi:hypothetical protein
MEVCQSNLFVKRFFNGFFIGLRLQTIRPETRSCILVHGGDINRSIYLRSIFNKMDSLLISHFINRATETRFLYLGFHGEHQTRYLFKAIFNKMDSLLDLISHSINPATETRFLYLGSWRNTSNEVFI